ncbi:flavin-containing monooxygenase [Actinacidiphila oryziradicis]|uniref:flavin-containing monooxygenase n=1 Tax=Actinacidiphila oryziradicis TaxID=2571141 RepID=UPI00267DD2CC|nr:NAD(P)/FAD-dependent oxidoreductase [Actinacidiphila oryziradicis]
MPFGGDGDRCPRRDEVVAYLASYAARLDAEIRTRTRVVEVRPDGKGFAVALEGGQQLAARAVVAASGTFGRPYRPDLPGLAHFAGSVLHAADYRTSEPFAGQRVIVVGAGDSAVQIAAELATAARVTLASRTPARFARQHILGRGLRFWLARTGIDTAPVDRFLRTPPTQLVIDDSRYRAALDVGIPDCRSSPAATAARVTWPDGTVEAIDAVLLATGYRPDLPYFDGFGALDGQGHPLHRDGASLTHPGLVYVGPEWQRSLSSNSLRGVGRDAVRAARRLAAHLARS